MTAIRLLKCTPTTRTERLFPFFRFRRDKAKGFGAAYGTEDSERGAEEVTKDERVVLPSNLDSQGLRV